jgi:hypothetical protein
MSWDHIDKLIFRLVACIAAVFGVTAVLYQAHFGIGP